MATGQSTTQTAPILSVPLFNVLGRKQNLCLLKCLFHNRLKSTENAFNRNQSKNSTEETETHMFLSVSISKKGHFQPQQSFCITYIAWAGQMTREFHSGAAGV